MASPQEHYQASVRFQEYFDQALGEIGMRAPQPTLGQSVNTYRREVDRLIKRTFLPQNHEFYKIQWRGLETDVLDRLEPQLLAAAKVEAFNPANVPKGELREITVRNPHNGSEVRKFVGQDHFVKLPNFGTGVSMSSGFREGRHARIWDPRGNQWFPPQSRRVA